jgi:selenocysteine lyase/cysteine desulfurase
MLSEKTGAIHRIVHSDKDYRFDMASFEEALTPDVRLVSFVYTSNLDGYTARRAR